MLAAGCLAVAPGAASAAGSPATGLSTTAVIAALAQEGVGVYAKPTSARPLRQVSAPAVPIRVLKSQAKAYAAQTADGGGVTGVELDQLTPMPAAPAGTQYPSFDYVLAAYASASATPGEALAHRLLASADLHRPDTVVFPDLVLTLMSADVYRAGHSAGHGAVDPAPPQSGSGAGSARIASGSLCSTLSDWVSSGFGALSKALTVGSSSNGALSFIGGLWNSAVSLAQSGLSNVATALTGPVLGAIREAVSAAALASWAVSTFTNLKASISTAPSYNKFGVEPAAGNTGGLTLTLGRPGGFAFPSGLTDCAQLLGIQLPSFDSIVGRKVDWTFTQVNGTPTASWCTTADCDLATEDTGTTATQLSSQHQATLNYVTNTETPAQVKSGALITNDYVLVAGTVKLDTQGLAKLLQDVVLGRVPAGVRTVVAPLINSLTSGVANQIARLAEPTDFRYVQIEHHGTVCLGGNWTSTSVTLFGGPAAGAGASWDFGADGIFTLDYNGSQPDPNGNYFSGEGSGPYTLTPTDATGAAGSITFEQTSGEVTYTYITYPPPTYEPTRTTMVVPPDGEQTATWTCSGNMAVFTESDSDGDSLVTDLARDAPG